MTVDTSVVASARVAHDEAPLDAVERADLGADDEAVVETLLGSPGVTEALVLQTCHRVEAYVAAADADAAGAALDRLDLGPSAVREGHEDSIHHLLRVAAGLESLVIGEDQVLGQVRDAYEAAREAGGMGPVLGRATRKAIHVGERARTETAINEGVVSLGSAAVRLAERESDLDGATALVVGAGEMGTLAAKALASAPVDEIVVANRTVDRARRVAETLPGATAAVGLDALPAVTGRAEVVVSATAAEAPVLDAEVLDGAGETVVVDLGRPRDVATPVPDDVAVHDIEALEAVTAETHDSRSEAAERVATMVDREFDRLLEAYRRRRADAVIAAMYEGADRVQRREVETAIDRMEAAGEVTDGQREVLESMADSLVSKLLAAPTKSLREAAGEDDWETVASAIRLMDPEFDDAESALGAELPDELPSAGDD